MSWVALFTKGWLCRLRFLGKVLIVERANQPNANNAHVKPQDQLVHGVSQVPSAGSQNQKNPTSTAEPIAPKLGVDYPFPPHLEYAYPPPDGNILTNIVNALIAVPRFYTQVLHLMNKMNLPAPFRMALPTPPLPSQVPAPPHPPPPPQPEEARSADLSSDESELESSDDDVDKRKSKRAKHEVIVGPAVDKSVAHEAVGVKPAALVSTELQVIKKKNPVLQIKIAPKTTQKEPPVQSTADKEMDSTNEQLEEKHFVTPQEIEKDKLPPEEILSLPMFKNYTPGNPAAVLYIKNLAKDVTHDDFFYVFGSLFESMDSARSGLSIKLMQEGRMRGQAFVTFPTVELAQRALVSDLILT
jgi:U11/U12 small nuclear ribonucleoprotein SNRNP65